MTRVSIFFRIALGVSLILAAFPNALASPAGTAASTCPRDTNGHIVRHRISDQKLDWLLWEHSWERPANLSCLDLRGLVHPALDAGNLNAQGADLTNAILDGAFLDAANLSEAILAEASLRDAKLLGAQLIGADLRNTKLSNSTLNGASLFRAQMRMADLRAASLEKANMVDADLIGADLTGALLVHALLQKAKLSGAILTGANLAHANLWNSDLSNAQLDLALLRHASLGSTRLSAANLSESNLENAEFRGADLTNAVLRKARLTGAEFRYANLTGADLRGADLSDIRITNLVVGSAIWGPITFPDNPSLQRITGIGNLWTCNQANTALTQLRESLRKHGLTHIEREATFALERSKTRYLLRIVATDIPEACQSGAEINPESLLDAVEGLFRFVFIEVPVGYGLYPGRAICLILIGIFISMFIYWAAISRSIRSNIPEAPPLADHWSFSRMLKMPAIRIFARSNGIFILYPTGRLIEAGGSAPRLADDTLVHRMSRGGLDALGMAFYFSLLSAFHFGWRDFNVSNWLVNLQPTEFALRAHGWVRVVSGVQSLLSLYFLAMWALFYFGRPLQ